MPMLPQAIVTIILLIVTVLAMASQRVRTSEVSPTSGGYLDGAVYRAKQVSALISTSLA